MVQLSFTEWLATVYLYLYATQPLNQLKVYTAQYLMDHCSTQPDLITSNWHQTVTVSRGRLPW